MQTSEDLFEAFGPIVVMSAEMDMDLRAWLLKVLYLGDGDTVQNQGVIWYLSLWFGKYKLKFIVQENFIVCKC